MVPAVIDPKAPSAVVSRPVFLPTFGRAWILTAVGGAFCGAVCCGVSSVEFFFFCMPAGFVLGALLGVPLGAAIAWWFAVHACPPQRPARFAARVEAFGAAVALAINTPTNIVFVLDETNRHFHPGVTTQTVLTLVLVAIACVAATAMTGRTCGRVLVRRHFQRCGLESPDRLARGSLFRRDPRLP